VDFAQADLKESGLDREKIKPILYRPFDIRYTYYTGKSRGFHCMPRPEVMGHMQKDNLGLTIGRQGHVVGENQIWNLAYVSTSIIDFNLFYRGGALLLPLYLYIDDSNRDLFNQTIGKRKTNIPKSIIDKLTGIYGGVFTPEKIVSYIYGILYSTTYRTKYEDFLKIDFPRIPFSAKPEVFFSISALGQRLINLHLLKGQEIDKPTIKFNGHGDDIKIFRPHYHDTEKRVFINEDYFFDNVEEVVWNYHIGGYQVLYKYLKDRKGRRMDDPRHYIRIATAIEKTIEIQKEIDALYPEVEKDVIEF
jgi:predicted helicase